MAVDQQIVGSQPSSPARRGKEEGEGERARGGTCRRRGTPGRLGVEGGCSGKLLGGGGVAGDAPRRRHGAVAEPLGFELRLLLRCFWVEGEWCGTGVVSRVAKGVSFYSSGELGGSGGQGMATPYRGRHGGVRVVPVRGEGWHGYVPGACKVWSGARRGGRAARDGAGRPG